MNHTNTPKATLKPFNLNKKLNQFLAVKKTRRNLFDIFLWWERKRIVFNILVLSLCFFSFEIQKLTTTYSISFFTKRELIIFIILYNTIYSGFCVLEFFLKKSKKYGPNMFKNALFICVSVITIPTIFQILTSIVF